MATPVRRSSQLPGEIYNALAPNSKEIRLITLQPGLANSRIICHIWTTPIEADPVVSYSALSYTWGAPSQHRSIDVRVGSHTHQLPVTENLYRALKGLRPRRGPPSDIWIDAICINQADMSERSAQVTLMSEIYRSADCVLVWLGQPSKRTNKPSLVDSIMYWRRVVTRTATKVEEIRRQIPDIESALTNTVPCWLDRAWVMQEVTTGSKIYLCYGRRRLKFDYWSPPGSLHHHNDPNVLTRRLFDKFRRLNHFAWFGDVADLDSTAKTAYMFRKAASMALSATSTDPRDKVYSLMGLISRKEAATITPNYHWPPWTVYSQATYANIANTGELDILELARQHDTEVEGLPTWSADFTRPSSTAVEDRQDLRGLCEMLNAAGDLTPSLFRYWEPSFSAGSRDLHIRGVELDSLIAGAHFPRGAAPSYEAVANAAIQFLGSYISTITETDSGSMLPAIEFDQDSLTFSSTTTPSSRIQSLAYQIFTCFDFWDRIARMNNDDDIRKLWKVRGVYSARHQEASGQQVFSHCANEDFQGSSAPTDTNSYDDSYDKYMNRPYPGEDNDDEERWNFLRGYEEYACYVTGGMSLICTSSGFLGITPGKTAAGDRLYLVRGACLPLLLRPTADGRWVFRGFAYVHGIGKGQMIDFLPGSQLEDRALVLC